MRAQSSCIGMVIDGFHQIVVKVVNQSYTAVATMRDERLCLVEISNGVAMRDEDFGNFAQDRYFIRDANVKVRADDRVVERLEQPDIGTGAWRAIVQSLREQNDARLDLRFLGGSG